ncbi:MAG: leucine-rich repeat protein [Lachnospiraceae bacterium]
MMKQILLAICFVATFLCVPLGAGVQAAECLENQGLRYEVLTKEDMTGTVSFLQSDGRKELIIPGQIICDGITYEVVSVRPYAFEGSGVEQVTLPATVTDCESAFSYCDTLTSIQVESESASYLSIDGVLYNKTGDTLMAFPGNYPERSYSIPDGVISIAVGAFEGNAVLEQVLLPDGLTTIFNDAFAGCVSLKEMILPDSVTMVESQAFYGCRALSNLVLSENLKTIKRKTFQMCKALSEVSIPEGVIEIEENAFGSCSSLTHVLMPATLQSVASNVFSYCFALQKFEVAAESTAFSTEDGVLYNKEKTSLVCYPAGKNDSSYIVLDGTAQIIDSSNGFCYASTMQEILKQVEIPDSVIFISDSVAFGGSEFSLKVGKDSYAESYAREKGLDYSIQSTVYAGPVSAISAVSEETQNTEIISVVGGRRRPVIRKSYCLKKGKKKKITIRYAEDAKKITYKLNRPRVAKVTKGGILKGKRVGKSKLTVKIVFRDTTYRLTSKVRVMR